METYYDCAQAVLDEKNFSGWRGGSLCPEALKCVPESALREWLASKRLNCAAGIEDDPAIIETLAS